MSEDVLKDLINDVAAGGAIRHLYDLGYSAEEIQRQIDFPMDMATIKQIIDKYEERLNSPEGDYKIIKEQTKYGRITYRKVKKEK